MKNYAFIGRWKSWYQRSPMLTRTTFVVTPVFFRRYLVQYPFCVCLLFLGAYIDVKGFTNMELGPYTKGPEVLKISPIAGGFGKNATGGRRGRVVIMTNTSDDGDGSFRWASQQCSQNGTTAVIFAVSGRIKLRSEIRRKAKNFTLTGQTVPGDDVCIIENEINFGGSESFIIRCIRFHVDEKDTSGRGHNAACLRVENTNNFIIDHCSFSRASEENTDFIDTHFSTVQWCISDEGLYYSVSKKGMRAYSGAWGGTSSTYHHNLFAYCNSRVPLMNGAQGKDPGQDIVAYMEHINNVNYDWGSRMATCGGIGESQDPEHHEWSCDLVDSYYKPGSVMTVRAKELEFFRQSSARKPNKAPLRAVSKWYFRDNVMEGDSQLTSDNQEGVYTDGSCPYSIDEMKASSFIIPSGKENYGQYWFDWELYTLSDQYKSAEKAYQSVLANKSGAGAFPHGKVDACIIKEVKSGPCTYTGAGDASSGAIPGAISSPDEAEGLDGLTYKTNRTITGTDQDGMGDAWEKEIGLDPVSPEDRNRTTEIGYTVLGIYLSSLVGESISCNFKK